MKGKRKEPAAVMAEDDSEDGEGALKTFHGRVFPNGAFVPGSLRAINPRRSDAAILNALLGTRPPERFPRELLQSVLESGLSGEGPAKQRFREFIEEVWFPPNRGRMGNAGQELLISHIKLGLAFRPKQHYGADRWAVSILASGGFWNNVDDRRDLKDLLSRAQQRTMNLVEKSFLDSLPVAPEAAEDWQVPQLPLANLNKTICSLVRSLVAQAKWTDSTNDDAERIALDIVALLRTGMYLNWILMHEQAHQAVAAFRKGTQLSFHTPMLRFGLSREKRSGSGRSFHQTQAHLDEAFEDGSFAIIALSQLHQVMGWSEAKWFSDLAADAGEERAPPAMSQWFRAYADALRGEKVAEPYVPTTMPETARQALCEMHTAISRNFKKWREKDNTRFSHRSTIGAVTSMALAEGGALFAPGSGNRKHLPLIDLDLYLLVGRALMTANGRTTARLRIGQDLRRLGIDLDDITEQAVELELERNGRIRKLSDAGESLYVRVD